MKNDSTYQCRLHDEMDTSRKAHLIHSLNVIVFVFAFFLR